MKGPNMLSRSPSANQRKSPDTGQFISGSKPIEMTGERLITPRDLQILVRFLKIGRWADGHDAAVGLLQH
jgi:hypothetical protein